MLCITLTDLLGHGKHKIYMEKYILKVEKEKKLKSHEKRGKPDLLFLSLFVLPGESDFVN